MRIIHGRPPNFDRVATYFPMVYDKKVVFAYAPDLYAPNNITTIPHEVIDHEAVHIERQERMGVEKWWKLYCIDPQFRFDEELLAHRAEYRALTAVNSSRHIRRSALKNIARKLASPLYGNMVTLKRAMELLEAA